MKMNIKIAVSIIGALHQEKPKASVGVVMESVAFYVVKGYLKQEEIDNVSSWVR